MELVILKDKFGFGYKRDMFGHLSRKPNRFGIKKGRGVEIGRYTCIDKGSYRDTVIGDYTKIDNNCMIGHNCILGREILIVAGVVLGGSSEIGDYTYIGMNVSIRDHVKIGKHVIVGAGSVVINDIPDNDIVAGNPAKSIKNKIKLSPEERFQMCGIRE